MVVGLWGSCHVSCERVRRLERGVEGLLESKQYDYIPAAYTMGAPTNIASEATHHMNNKDIDS